MTNLGLAGQDQRAFERGRAFLKAKIIFNNRMTTIDCVVKNISAGGAKIAVGSALTIPNEFDLEIPQRGKTYRVQMRWRDSDAIGVEFIDGGEDRDAGGPRLHKLEEENARLRAAVLELSKRLADLGQDVPHFL